MPLLFNYSGLLYLKNDEIDMYGHENKSFASYKENTQTTFDNVLTGAVHILLARCQARLLCITAETDLRKGNVRCFSKHRSMEIFEVGQNCQHLAVKVCSAIHFRIKTCPKRDFFTQKNYGN